MRGAVPDRYKKVSPHREQDQLFDLTSDPDELDSLFEDPRHAGELATRRQELTGWMQRTGDFLHVE